MMVEANPCEAVHNLWLHKGSLFKPRALSFGHIYGLPSRLRRARQAKSIHMLTSMPSDRSNDDVTTHRCAAWFRHLLQGRLFAVAWALAVIIATAGWFYFIFRIIWYLISPLFQ
ncbi:MAG: hypothetical protein JWP25_8219 [Bradyrhizobium sp.]|nr:hypothetical protein [Bradyrhizobium sp.]